MHSTLLVDGNRRGSDDAARVLGSSRVCVWVVEGVERAVWRDLEVKASAGCPVADGQFHAIDIGVPKEKHLDRSGQPPCQLSSGRVYEVAPRGHRAVAWGDGLYQAG